MWQAQEFMRRIGTVLRNQHDDSTRERLPERWVELIRYLNEKEGGESEAPKSEPRPDAHRQRRSNAA